MTKRGKQIGDLAVPASVLENVRGGKDKKKTPPSPPPGTTIGTIIGGPVIGTTIGGGPVPDGDGA